MPICQFCLKVCKNNRSHVAHERTCPFNVNRNYKNGMTGKTAWNKGLTRKTDSRVDSYAKTISISVKKLPLHGCYAKEWYTSEKGRNASSKGGGYREKSGRSNKFITTDSFGNRVCLQSSYEKLCSEILNEMGFRWIRPSHLMYNEKRYFADFYLLDYNLYLDPKNDYKAKIDEDKIIAVQKQNNVEVIVLHYHQITKEFIANVVQR